MITWTKIGEGSPLPSPDNIDEVSNPYYLIYTKYGASQAMYIKDEYGNCEWYGNYEYKVCTNVLAWCELNKP